MTQREGGTPAEREKRAVEHGIDPDTAAAFRRLEEAEDRREAIRAVKTRVTDAFARSGRRRRDGDDAA